MGGDDVHQPRERGNQEQALAYQAGVDVGQLTHQERPFSQLADTLELPSQVADEGAYRLPAGNVTKTTTEPVVCPPARTTTTEPSPYTS